MNDIKTRLEYMAGVYYVFGRRIWGAGILRKLKRGYSGHGN